MNKDALEKLLMDISLFSLACMIILLIAGQPKFAGFCIHITFFGGVAYVAIRNVPDDKW